jgi:hypothetical protein
MADEFPTIHVEYPGQPSNFTPPVPLPDLLIEEIHSGLAIPSSENIHSMAREIRKWRGVPNPDSI